MAFTSAASRDANAPFTANIRGMATKFNDRDGNERTQYEASATGLEGTGKAAGRNISLSLSIADMQAMLDDAKSQGFATLRFTAWKRDPKQA